MWVEGTFYARPNKEKYEEIRELIKQSGLTIIVDSPSVIEFEGELDDDYILDQLMEYYETTFEVGNFLELDDDYIFDQLMEYYETTFEVGNFLVVGGDGFVF